MNGWVEKNEKIKSQIKDKLLGLPPIFDDFYIDMQGDGKSMSTIKTYINYVVHFMNYVTNNITRNDFYKDVTSTQIKKYLITLETRQKGNDIVKISDDYRALNWSAINTFFNFLVVNDYLQTNPMLKTKRPKINTEHKVTYMNKQEIATVMKSIDNNYTGNMLTRDRAIIGLALTTGLRVSALVQINLEDIDFDNNTIKVIEKRMKIRTISYGDNTKKLLQDWVSVRNKKYGYVDTNALFLSQRSRRITTNGVRDLVKKYTHDIESRITPHKLRSSAATLSAAEGVSLQAVANMLGHESLQTTKRYINVLDKERDQLVHTLDNLI